MLKDMSMDELEKLEQQAMLDIQAKLVAVGVTQLAWDVYWEDDESNLGEVVGFAGKQEVIEWAHETIPGVIELDTRLPATPSPRFPPVTYSQVVNLVWWLNDARGMGYGAWLYDLKTDQFVPAR